MNRILPAIILIVLSSCSDDVSSNLSGKYTETFPVNGRTTLVFFGEKVKMNTGGDDEIYSYQISENKIILTLVTDKNSSSEHEFDRKSLSRFTIENLYPGIPEAPIVLMEFKKQ